MTVVVRVVRVVVSVVLVAAAVVLPGGVVQSAAVAPAGAAQAEGDLAPVMLVLDASGSMEESDPSGGSRMDAAKDAVTGLVEEAPEDAQLGLTVYGAGRGKAQNVRKVGCKDVETVAPVGGVGSAGLQQAVEGVEPGGFTPIGRSLRQAAKALPAEGPRSVILVSDGEDTCAPPPPCEVARELKKQGVDLTMHTVGFRVGKKAREELRCIADIGGGSYVDAPDADTLESELPSIAERAFRNYRLEGEPITGTEQPAGAPRIAPGQWVDTVDAGQIKHYALEVPEGFTVHTAATIAMARDDESPMTTDRLELTTSIVDQQGVACATQDETATDWQPILTSAFGWVPGEDSECLVSEDMYLTVERQGHSETNYPTSDVEILVVLEPPVTGDSGPDAASTMQPFEAPPGKPESVVGGGSFNDATELPGTGRYADDVRYGEMATYKVWLDWGESFALRVSSGEGKMEGYPSWPELAANVYGPTRTQGYEWGQNGATQDEPVALEPIRLPEVTYENREDTAVHDVGTASLPGWHYITVDWSRDPSTAAVPVELQLDVGGEKTEGPQYAEVDGYPAEPVTEDPEASGEESESEPADDPEAEAGDSPDETDDEDTDRSHDVQAASSDEGVSPLLWVLAGTGAVLVLAVVLATSIIVRRRSRPRS